MKLVGGASGEPRWLNALAGALMLGGPVWHYLYVNRYPFDRPEAIVLPLLGAVAGAALISLGRQVGGLVEVLIFGVVLFGFVDLQFDLDHYLPTVIIASSCLAIPSIVRTRRAVLTSITLGTLYLASIPRFGPDAPPTQAATASEGAARPLLVHIILDGQWGIGGMRAEGDTATASFLTDFYLSRGFELYEAAYSRFARTQESIGSTVSLGAPPVFHSPQASPEGLSLRSIPYFDRLRAMGYSIRVYQSTYLDFCHARSAPVASCETQKANSIGNIGRLPGDWWIRGLQAGRYFINMTSHVYARLHPDPDTWRRANLGGALLAMQHASRDVASGLPRNSALFLHVLAPHRPVRVDADCRYLRDPPWRYEDPPFTLMSDSAWRSLLDFEAGQMRCVHRAVADLVAAVDNSVGREHSIIVIHGDHGVRRFQHPPASRAPALLDGRGLNAQFSTLLAVRRPGIPAALHGDAVPVQDFLRELVRHDFDGTTRGPFAHFVRGEPVDTLVRVLSISDMLWARAAPPAPVTSPSRR